MYVYMYVYRLISQVSPVIKNLNIIKLQNLLSYLCIKIKKKAYDKWNI